MGTNVDDLATAADAHTALAASDANDRERGHARAIGAWLAGDWYGAAAGLDDVLVQWPTDLLALMFVHQLDFFVGAADQLRDRPRRSLAPLGDHPHAGFVRGMAAFGLEESGQYDEALDLGLAAVAAHPDDVWAIHAVVHTHEMRGAVDAGIRFLRSADTAWETGNLFTVHNWWHLALYQLEAGRPDEALAIYDAEIHHAGSDGVPIEMLDAERAAVAAPPGRGRHGGAVRRVGGRVGARRPDGRPGTRSTTCTRRWRWSGPGGSIRLAAWPTGWPPSCPRSTGTNARFVGEVGLPVSQAVVAFGEGRHGDVVELLAPIRHQLHVFGGSHAQRDAFQRTLLESALRSGQYAPGRHADGRAARHPRHQCLRLDPAGPRPRRAGRRRRGVSGVHQRPHASGPLRRRLTTPGHVFRTVAERPGCTRRARAGHHRQRDRAPARRARRNDRPRRPVPHVRHRGRWRHHARLRCGATEHARAVGDDRPVRRSRLHRLRGRAAHLRRGPRPGAGAGSPAPHRARRRPRRSGGGVDAQLPRMGHHVLGLDQPRGGSGRHERVVDDARDGLRPARLATQGAGGRRRTAGAPHPAAGRPPATPSPWRSSPRGSTAICPTASSGGRTWCGPRMPPTRCRRSTSTPTTTPPSSTRPARPGFPRAPRSPTGVRSPTSCTWSS